MKAQTTHGEEVADAGMRSRLRTRLDRGQPGSDPLTAGRQLASCERAVAEAGGQRQVGASSRASTTSSRERCASMRGLGKGLAGFDRLPIAQPVGGLPRRGATRR
jgi:hypothetical protein